jgi:hypothetical protein
VQCADALGLHVVALHQPPRVELAQGVGAAVDRAVGEPEAARLNDARQIKAAIHGQVDGHGLGGGPTRLLGQHAAAIGRATPIAHVARWRAVHIDAVCRDQIWYLLKNSGLTLHP